jgi:lactoylglutathione lyase
VTGDVTGLRLELFVADVERSVAFYRRVLGFAEDHHVSDRRYVPMRRGQARIGIGRADALPDDHPVRRRAEERGGLGVEIVLELPDLEAAYHHARAVGHPLASELTRQPWGLVDFRLLDPDGYYLRITEPTPGV